VYVEAGRVDAVLDAQRLAGGVAAFELLPEFGRGLDLRRPAEDDRELLLDRGEGHRRNSARRRVIRRLRR
jgi:hypothetical protein